MATVLIGLITITLLGLAAGMLSRIARRHRPQRSGMHALRDDYTIDPVAAPLRRGCGSLEIAVRLDPAGRLQIGTGLRSDSAGNAIGPLVLRELALRAAAYGGRVRPRQTDSITLMIEILEADPVRQVRAYDVLDAELRRYPKLFTHVVDDSIVIGPVTVVLIGAGTPRHAVAASMDRYAFCEGSFGDVGAWGAPVPLVPTVGEHWAWRFGWDGTDAIPTEERLLLQQLVRAAHEDGRQVRVFGIPERNARTREAFWRVLLDAGVDVISTRKPQRLAAFLDAAPAPRPVPMDDMDRVEGSLQAVSAR